MKSTSSKLLVTGSLTYNPGSIFSWDLAAGPADPGANTSNSGSYDRVTAGSVTGASAVFNIVLGGSFSDAFWDTNKSWTNILGGASDLAAIFTSFSGTGVSSGGVVAGRGSFSFSGSTLNYDSAIPEPTSALAGILLGAGLLRRRRK